MFKIKMASAVIAIVSVVLVGGCVTNPQPADRPSRAPAGISVGFIRKRGAGQTSSELGDDSRNNQPFQTDLNGSSAGSTDTSEAQAFADDAAGSISQDSRPRNVSATSSQSINVGRSGWHKGRPPLEGSEAEAGKKGVIAAVSTS